MAQVARGNILRDLDEKCKRVMHGKLDAAPTMNARSRALWTLPHKLTLHEAHSFLQERLAMKLNRPARELRVRLELKFHTWQDKSELFKICDTLDKLLFGGILGNNVGYIHVPMVDMGYTRYFTRVPSAFEQGGYFYILVAVQKDLASELQRDGYPRRRSYAELWGTLIHEMLHAYTMIATGKDGPHLDEQCKCGQLSDHGPMWCKTITMLAARLNIGIDVSDMTNRLDICHDPDPSTDIKDYGGVLRTSRRRYSESHDSVRHNTTSKAEKERRELRAAKQKALDPEQKQAKPIRHRRGTFPGCAWKDRDGTISPDFYGPIFG